VRVGGTEERMAAARARRLESYNGCIIPEFLCI
jgi:hypothetical protein